MKRRYIYHIGLAIVLSFALLVNGCGGKSDKSKQSSVTIVTAQMKKSVTKLYYKGTLQPIKNIPVLSPVDGTITGLHFKYGESIKEGQELVIINSAKLASDYRDAITKYLQSKDTYETSLQSFQGTQALHKAGVISTDEYMTDKNQFETNILNFYQSRFDLEKILKKAGTSPEQIEKLSIADTQEVAKILQKKFTDIMVQSPGSGVALFPVPDQSSGDKDNSGKLTVGSEVKEGQLILSIGNLSGFSATLQVSEVHINQMQMGLKVLVTGYAFPGITLRGVITGVAKQANPDQGSNGGTLSMFNIEVAIPDITEQEKEIIHVGMTANFEIDIENPPMISVPINAVFQKNGQSYVTIIDPKTKKQKDVLVTTGTTTLTDVSILSGLKQGDKVLVHD